MSATATEAGKRTKTEPEPAPEPEIAAAVSYDFDVDRRAHDSAPRETRSFRLGGEVFYYIAAVRPEKLLEFEALQETGRDPRETFEIIDQTILSMVEDYDGAHKRYRAVRAREDDPVGLGTLRAVAEWLIERQTDRTPTRPVSPSSRGRSTGGTR